MEDSLTKKQVKAMSGNRKSSTIPTLKTDKLCVSDSDKCKVLVDHFARVSSDENYDEGEDGVTYSMIQHFPYSSL